MKQILGPLIWLAGAILFIRFLVGSNVFEILESSCFRQYSR